MKCLKQTTQKGFKTKKNKKQKTLVAFLDKGLNPGPHPWYRACATLAQRERRGTHKGQKNEDGKDKRDSVRFQSPGGVLKETGGEKAEP